MNGTMLVLPADVVQYLANVAWVRAPHHSMNGYHCRACDGTVLTIDVDLGVTPMTMPCVGRCAGRSTAVSLNYPPQQPPAEPALEFYRPSAEEAAELSVAALEHVLKGGLLVRGRDAGESRPGAYTVEGMRASMDWVRAQLAAAESRGGDHDADE